MPDGDIKGVITDSQFVQKAQAVSVATSMSSSELRSSDNDMITYIEQLNSDWRTALAKQRDRLFRNIRLYVPVDGSAWDDDAYKKMLEEGRHPVSFDIASRKIDTLAGSIRAEKWDFDFQALNISEAPLLKRIKYLYFADKGKSVV